MVNLLEMVNNSNNHNSEYTEREEKMVFTGFQWTWATATQIPAIRRKEKKYNFEFIVDKWSGLSMKSTDHSR